MADFESYGENQLNVKYGDGGTTQVVTEYGFSSTTPNADGTNITEPPIGTNGYARTPVGAAQMGPAGATVANRKDNVAVLESPLSTGAWLSGVPLTHVVEYDSAGNPISFGALSPAQAVTGAGQRIRFPIGDYRALIA